MTVLADTSPVTRRFRRRSPLSLLSALFFLAATPGRPEDLPLFPPSATAGELLASSGELRADGLGLAELFPAPSLDASAGAATFVPADLEEAAEASLAQEAEADAPQPSKKPRKLRATLITVGVLAGNIASTLSGPINKGFVPFHTDTENWFGKNTYAGGADKASHFVLYNILSRELHIAYYRAGYGDPAAYWMAFATSVGAGMITEIGDSLGHGGGGSYEDVISDTLGAAGAIFVTKHGLDDVWGFRFGLVPNHVPEPCCPVTFPGKDYSEEIYTGDLKLAGLAKRTKTNIGLARFLLLSVTYSAKGYRNSLVEFRQQQIGIEVGINFPQILTEIGVQDTTWWGRCLFLFFNAFRVPYTQIGMRYDFIHHEWHGPNIGDAYDPGPGIPPP
jgi:hypothetical protein